MNRMLIMNRILVLLGSCLFFVACDTTITSESSKTIELTLDTDAQAEEEERPLDFLFEEEEKPLDWSNDIDGEDLNKKFNKIKKTDAFPLSFTRDE